MFRVYIGDFSKHKEGVWVLDGPPNPLPSRSIVTGVGPRAISTWCLCPGQAPMGPGCASCPAALGGHSVALSLPHLSKAGLCQGPSLTGTMAISFPRGTETFGACEAKMPIPLH